MSWLNKYADAPWLRQVRRYWAWIAVVLTLLLVLGVRWRLRDMPLERDEGEYAYVAQLMLQGVAPYADVYIQKLPGTPAFYALSMAIFGHSPAGIHIGLALANLTSIFLVFLLGRRLMDHIAGVTAALSFALLSMNPWVLGLAGHATHYVVFTALVGIFLLLRACDAEPTRGRDSKRSGAHRFFAALNCPGMLFFVSGLCFGLSFLMKQHGILFGVFGGVYLVWRRVGDWMTGHLTEVPLRPDGDDENTEGDESRRRVLIPSRGGRLRRDLRQPGRFRGELVGVVIDASLFASGFVIPYALTCLILIGAGAFHPFVFWTITYAGKYSSAISLVKGSDVVHAAVSAVIGPNLILWILPFFGGMMMWWESRLDDGSSRLEKSSRRNPDIGGPWSMVSTPAPGFHAQPSDDATDEKDGRAVSSRRLSYSGVRYARVFLTALLVCSVLSVSVGLYFRAHYFIMLLPVLALLTGVAVSRSVYLLQHDRTIELFLALPILVLFVIAVGAALIGNGSTWFGMTPRQAMASVYGTTLFSETAAVADFIKNNSTADTRVAVLGSEPEIYFYSGRRAATGHIYTYPLMEQHEFALKMQEQMISEIERTKPDFLVYVDDELSWLARPGSDRKIFEWWKEYWARDLDLVKTVEFKEGLERGADADNETARGLVRGASRSAMSEGNILILKRNK